MYTDITMIISSYVCMDNNLGIVCGSVIKSLNL